MRIKLTKVLMGMLLRKKKRRTHRKSTENRTCLMMLVSIGNKPLKSLNQRITKI